MSTLPEVVSFEHGQAVHLVASSHDNQGIFPATVETAEKSFVVVRILHGAAAAGVLAVGSYVHLVDATGRWERARVTQLEVHTGVLVSLETSVAVASLRSRGFQRQYQRVTARGLFGYAALLTGRGATRFRVQILDVSAGGASLMARQPLGRGDELHLQLPPLDTVGALQLTGRVAWSTQVSGASMAGVQFARCTEAQSQALQRFIFTLRWRGGTLSDTAALG